MKSQRLPWALMVLMVPVLAGSSAGPQSADRAEKELRAEFKSEFGRHDPERRLKAIQDYDAGTRALPLEEAQSRLVAKTLARGLTDDDMTVCLAAINAVSWGRDVGTTIDGLEDGLSHYLPIMVKTSSRPDTESRDLYRGASSAYRAACTALANYKDDRSTKHLEDHFRKINSGGSIYNVSQSLVRPLADGLLSLGSQRAVEVVVKQTARFTASRGRGTGNREQMRQGTAYSLHNALAAFSRSIERVPPEFTQNYQQDWHDWFKENKQLFPEKLGKLEAPPSAPADTSMTRRSASDGREKP